MKLNLPLSVFAAASSLVAVPLAGAQQTAQPRQQQQPASSRHPKPLMRDFIGINAHTVQFKPELYAPLCRLVRDYHPFGWDVHDDTARPTAFPMAQHIDWEDKSGNFRS